MFRTHLRLCGLNPCLYAPAMVTKWCRVNYFKNQAVLGPLLGLPLEAMILFLQSKAPGEECQLCREAAKNVFTSWSPKHDGYLRTLKRTRARSWMSSWPVPWEGGCSRLLVGACPELHIPGPIVGIRSDFHPSGYWLLEAEVPTQDVELGSQLVA